MLSRKRMMTFNQVGRNDFMFHVTAHVITQPEIRCQIRLQKKNSIGLSYMVLSGGSFLFFYSLELHLRQEKAFSGNSSTAVDGSC
jgi:hypothetical protein